MYEKLTLFTITKWKQIAAFTTDTIKWNSEILKMW